MTSRMSVGSGGLSIDCASTGIRARSRASSMPRGPNMLDLVGVCFCQRLSSVSVILQGAITVAVIRITCCAHIKLVQDYADHLRASKMQPLQCGFDHSASCFTGAEYE